MFRINPASGKAIYEQIMEQVKEAAWKGYLKPGDGLPSVRKLALQLSVTPNTVAKAYQLLEKEKVIDVEEGSIHGLVGRNGCGKTTLIKCITGIYEQDQGQILICGEEVFENPKVKAKVGYVADSNQYFDGYHIDEMIEFINRCTRHSRRKHLKTTIRVSD